MAIKASLLVEFDHEMGSTRKLLDRLPDGRFDWTPHAKSMTLGGLATHVATIPHWSAAILGQAGFDLASAPPNQSAKATRTEVLQAFDAAVAQARSAMDKSDAEWAAPWTLRRGDHVMFSMPRVAAFRSFILSHVIHHRGQLTVYLRMNDVPLPSIYGPSADEG